MTKHTTRDDATDMGVPMTPGEGPQGPEDALDPNARGDYTDRLGEGRSTSVELDENGKPVVVDQKARVKNKRAGGAA